MVRTAVADFVDFKRTGRGDYAQHEGRPPVRNRL